MIHSARLRCGRAAAGLLVLFGLLAGSPATAVTLSGLITSGPAPVPAVVGQDIITGLTAVVLDPPRANEELQVQGPLWYWEIVKVESAPSAAGPWTQQTSGYTATLSTQPDSPNAVLTTRFQSAANWRVTLRVTAAYTVDGVAENAAATLIVNGLNVSSDAPATIDGTVKDPNGVLLSGQIVRLKRAGQVLGRVDTGADGAFAFTPLAPGSYEVAVEAQPADQRDDPDAQTATVAAGERKTLDFATKAEGGGGGGGVHVAVWWWQDRTKAYSDKSGWRLAGDGGDSTVAGDTCEVLVWGPPGSISGIAGITVSEAAHHRLDESYYPEAFQQLVATPDTYPFLAPGTSLYSLQWASRAPGWHNGVHTISVSYYTGGMPASTARKVVSVDIKNFVLSPACDEQHLLVLQWDPTDSDGAAGRTKCKYRFRIWSAIKLTSAVEFAVFNLQRTGPSEPEADKFSFPVSLSGDWSDPLVCDGIWDPTAPPSGQMGPMFRPAGLYTWRALMWGQGAYTLRYLTTASAYVPLWPASENGQSKPEAEFEGRGADGTWNVAVSYGMQCAQIDNNGNRSTDDDQPENGLGMGFITVYDPDFQTMLFNMDDLACQLHEGACDGRFGRQTNHKLVVPVPDSFMQKDGKYHFAVTPTLDVHADGYPDHACRPALAVGQTIDWVRTEAQIVRVGDPGAVKLGNTQPVVAKVTIGTGCRLDGMAVTVEELDDCHAPHAKAELSGSWYADKDCTQAAGAPGEKGTRWWKADWDTCTVPLGHNGQHRVRMQVDWSMCGVSQPPMVEERAKEVANLVVHGAAGSPGTADLVLFDPGASSGSPLRRPSVSFEIQDEGKRGAYYRWVVYLRDTRETTWTDYCRIEGRADGPGAVTAFINDAAAHGQQQDRTLTEWGSYAFEIQVDEYMTGDGGGVHQADTYWLRYPYLLTVPAAAPGTTLSGHDVQWRYQQGDVIFTASYYLSDARFEAPKRVWMDVYGPDLTCVAQVDLPAQIGRLVTDVEVLRAKSSSAKDGTYIFVLQAEDSHGDDPPSDPSLTRYYREHENKHMVAVNRRVTFGHPYVELKEPDPQGDPADPVAPRNEFVFANRAFHSAIGGVSYNTDVGVLEIPVLAKMTAISAAPEWNDLVRRTASIVFAREVGAQNALVTRLANTYDSSGEILGFGYAFADEPSSARHGGVAQAGLPADPAAFGPNELILRADDTLVHPPGRAKIEVFWRGEETNHPDDPSNQALNEGRVCHTYWSTAIRTPNWFYYYYKACQSLGIYVGDVLYSIRASGDGTHPSHYIEGESVIGISDDVWAGSRDHPGFWTTFIPVPDPTGWHNDDELTCGLNAFIRSAAHEHGHRDCYDYIHSGLDRDSDGDGVPDWMEEGTGILDPTRQDTCGFMAGSSAFDDQEVYCWLQERGKFGPPELDWGAGNGLSFGLKPPPDDAYVRVHWARATGR